jgi:thioredoxin reductase (NADPH)
MRIENYLGFPTGITGAELAERAVVQAYKFGAVVSVPASVTNLGFDGTYPVLGLEGGERVVAKCLLIAAGVDYRRLPVEGTTKFEGRGIYYAATPTEVDLCVGSDVVVVGGGNSAGQAAVYLSGVVRRVFLVVRAGALDKSMSAYLARRIEQTANVDVLLCTTVRRIIGNEWLEAVDIVSEVGQARTIRTPALFSFIGATPRTDWLPPEIERDQKGFVRTGPAIAEGTPAYAGRRPFLLETSRPGVFAAGDVRSGSVKRVASAVGEGAMAVQLVHEYLKGM